jgi:hypothetical protein
VFFDLFDPKEGLKIVLLNAERSSKEEQECCFEKLRTIQEQMRLQMFSTGTLVTKGPLWQRNTLMNLPRILTNPGVGVLDGCFAGKPAIIVGAGPSLNDAIPYLQEIQDRVLIITTGTALTPLRKANIKPDLVIAVDASHLVAKQFTVPCNDLFFVGATIVCPEIPGRFKGEFYSLLDSNPIDQWVRSISNVEGTLMAGGTVTACGMHLANTLGCDPVVTVGLDLAYADDGHSHASDTMYHGRKVEQHHLIPVEGNWQEHVYTTRQFKCYVDLIKHYVQNNSDRRFVNITNGGARIKGMEVHKTDYLPTLAGEPFDAAGLLETLHTANLPATTWQAQQGLSRIVDYLDEVQKMCRLGAMSSNRLMLMNRFPERADPEEMRRCIQEIQDIDEALDNGNSDYEFLQMSLWPAAYALSAQSAQDEEGKGERMLGRSRQFYEQVAGAARWTRQLILNCCSTLEQRAA